MQLNEKQQKNIKITDCKKIGEFVDYVKQNTGNDKVSSSTIHYHLKNTDNLDWFMWCDICLIVINKKAKEFNPGTYHKGRPAKEETPARRRIDSFKAK